MDQFPQDVLELLEYFRPAVPGQALQAVPGASGEAVEIWILGSSTFGAQLAAKYCWASPMPSLYSHFAPEQMPEAVATYRARFRPSQHLATPHVMLGVNVFASRDGRRGGTASVLVPSASVPELAPWSPRASCRPRLTISTQGSTAPRARAMLADALACSIVGGPETVRDGDFRPSSRPTDLTS